jgi:hypothetical protein
MTYFHGQHAISPRVKVVYRPQLSTLIKKIIKFSSYIRKFRSGAVAKAYMRKGFLIYEKTRKYFPIYEEAVSHI